MRVGTTFWRSESAAARTGVYPYIERHVIALRSQIKAAGHQLTVLSNQPIADRDLRCDRLWGWWSKLEWFAPWNADLRPCLVFDLDTFVVGDIDPVLQLDPDRLWMIRQFLNATRLGESGIFIAPRDQELCDAIWHAVESLDLSAIYGDGVFLRQFPHSFIPDEVDGILSYKAHRLQGGYPAGTRVVCFHGRPRPHEAGGWARNWFDRHAG